MKYTCIRIYNNGDFELKTLNEVDMKDWLQYNIDWRPGCALVINGEIKQKGYLDEERILARAADIERLPSYSDAAPRPIRDLPIRPRITGR